MVSSMPHIDVLLNNFESVMWFCVFDACSGFWAIENTARAREVTAFICPLGHFEWLRMPQGLMNAPPIYQQMMDNAIWGFVKPKAGWDAFEVVKDDNGIEMDIFSNGAPEEVMSKPVGRSWTILVLEKGLGMTVVPL